VNRSTQIHAISASLNEMLKDLSDSELNSLEDFIVNECDESFVDDDGNPPNLFRMLLDTGN
jgi:hypothetical protein